MSARYPRDPTPGLRPRGRLPMGDSSWAPGIAWLPRPKVIQRDPQPRRGWAERRVLGISLQMNIAPRSAVSPLGALANVGMFAVTKCLENRILRTSENPPSPGAATQRLRSWVAPRLATCGGSSTAAVKCRKSWSPPGGTWRARWPQRWRSSPGVRPSATERLRPRSRRG